MKTAATNGIFLKNWSATAKSLSTEWHSQWLRNGVHRLCPARRDRPSWIQMHNKKDLAVESFVFECCPKERQAQRKLRRISMGNVRWAVRWRMVYLLSYLLKKINFNVWHPKLKHAPATWRNHSTLLPFVLLLPYLRNRYPGHHPGQSWWGRESVGNPSENSGLALENGVLTVLTLLTLLTGVGLFLFASWFVFLCEFRWKMRFRQSVGFRFWWRAL